MDLEVFFCFDEEDVTVVTFVGNAIVGGVRVQHVILSFY